MKCKVCDQQWPKERGYCARCLLLVKKAEKELEITYQYHTESLARLNVFPPQKCDSETFATVVDLDWHFTEIADAIRRRRRLWEVAGSLPGDAEGFGGAILLHLSGVGKLGDGQLAMLGENLGAVVVRGTEPDTLYIAGL